MECHLCRHDKTHKQGQTIKGTPRRYCPHCPN